MHRLLFVFTLLRCHFLAETLLGRVQARIISLSHQLLLGVQILERVLVSIQHQLNIKIREIVGLLQFEFEAIISLVALRASDVDCAVGCGAGHNDAVDLVVDCVGG